MGISRFKGEVLKHQSELCTVNLIDGASLLVDASGFVHWVADRVQACCLSENVAVDGLLKAFSMEAFRKEAETLLKQITQRQIRLVFVFDNNCKAVAKGLKAATERNRREDRLKTNAEWVLNVIKNHSFENSPKQLPTGTSKVLQELCNEMNITCIRAPGEADWYLAFMYLYTNEFLAIVANDTDFLAYRDCQAILDFNELLQDQVHIFSQSRVSAWLGFFESDYDDFLDFVLLRGTDYTRLHLETTGLYDHIYQRYRTRVGNSSLLDAARCFHSHKNAIRSEIHRNGNTSAIWSQAKDLYCLRIIAPEMHADVEALRRQDSAEWKEALYHAAIRGNVQKAVAGLILTGEHVGNPHVDPLAVMDGDLGVHERCSTLRKTVYSVLGIPRVHENLYNGIDTVSRDVTVEAMGTPEKLVVMLLSPTMPTNDGDVRDYAYIVKAMGEKLGLDENAQGQLLGLMRECVDSQMEFSVVLALLYFMWHTASLELSSEIFSEVPPTTWTLAFASAMLDLLDLTSDETLPESAPDLEVALGRLAVGCNKLSDRSSPLTNMALLLWSELQFYMETISLTRLAACGCDLGDMLPSSWLCLTTFVERVRVRLSDLMSESTAPHPVAAQLAGILSTVTMFDRGMLGSDDDMVEEGQYLLDNDDCEGTVTEEFMAKTFKPAQVMKLPIEKYRGEIMQALQSHKVIVLHGDTGTGKSTQVPQYIIQQHAYARVVVTQPRRLATVSLATRVAAELGEQVGKTVGFKIGGERDVSHKTRITFVTTGWLLQFLTHLQKRARDGFQTAHDPFPFTHVILDEAHERSVENDLVTMLLRRMVDTSDDVMHALGPDIKLLLMSATIDGGHFVNYFSEVVPNENIAVVTLQAPHPYPIEHVHLETMDAWFKRNNRNLLESRLQFSTQKKKQEQLLQHSNVDAIKCDCPFLASQMHEAIADLALQLVDNAQNVLVFVGGFRDIEAIGGHIAERVAEEHATVVVVPLHSQIDLPFQVQSLDHSEHPLIFLATNLAESSLTLPHVSYTIDTGLTKGIQYDQMQHTALLRPMWVSQASARQRAGRTGRVAPGVAFHLYTEEFHAAMAPYDTPELLRTPLDTTVLRIRVMDIGGSSEVLGRCLDPPEAANIANSTEHLFTVGALESNSESASVTRLGKITSMLAVEPHVAIMIVYGVAFGCLEESIVMAAYVSIASPYISLSPLNCTLEVWTDLAARKAKGKQLFGGSYSSDLIGALVMYETLVCRGPAATQNSRCYRYGISSKRLRLFETTVKQLSDRMQKIFPEYTNALAALNLHRVKFMWRLEHDLAHVHLLRFIILGTFRGQFLISKNKPAKGLKREELNTTITFKATKDVPSNAEKVLGTMMSQYMKHQFGDELSFTVKRKQGDTLVVRFRVPETEATSSHGLFEIQDYSTVVKVSNHSDLVHQLKSCKFALGIGANIRLDVDNPELDASQPGSQKMKKELLKLLVEPAFRPTWRYRMDKVTISRDSALESVCDMSLIDSQSLFAVTAKILRIQKPEGGLILLAVCNTYLPYPPLAIVLMLTTLTQQAHEISRLILRTHEEDDDILVPECYGMRYKFDEQEDLLGLGFLSESALNAALNTIMLIRHQLSRTEMQEKGYVNQKVKDLVWYMLLLSAASNCMLRALPRQKFMCAEHIFEPLRASDNWGRIRIGAAVVFQHLVSYLGTLKLTENKQKKLKGSIRTLQVLLRTSQPQDGHVARLHTETQAMVERVCAELDIDDLEDANVIQEPPRAMSSDLVEDQDESTNFDSTMQMPDQTANDSSCSAHSDSSVECDTWFEEWGKKFNAGVHITPILLADSAAGTHAALKVAEKKLRRQRNDEARAMELANDIPLVREIMLELNEGTVAVDHVNAMCKMRTGKSIGCRRITDAAKALGYEASRSTITVRVEEKNSKSDAASCPSDTVDEHELTQAQVQAPLPVIANATISDDEEKQERNHSEDMEDYCSNLILPNSSGDALAGEATGRASDDHKAESKSVEFDDQSMDSELDTCSEAQTVDSYEYESDDDDVVNY